MWTASSDPDSQARPVRMTLCKDLIKQDRHIKMTDTDISTGSRTINWTTQTLNYLNISILPSIK